MLFTLDPNDIKKINIEELKNKYGIKLYNYYESNQKKFIEIYKKCKSLLYISLNETIGLPIIEAMKSGCPVIVKNGSSIDEVVNNSGLMLKTADPAEIAEAIKGFDDLNLRNKFIKIGIENSYRFTTSKLIKNYNMLYSL